MMSRCPGLHCEGCGRGGGIAILAAAGAAIAVIVEFLAELLIVAGAVVTLALTVSALVLVRMKRQGQLSLRPGGAWEPNAVRPVSPAAPVTARPSRALPGPQTVTFNFYGVTPEQAAQEIAAIRDGGYQAFDQHEGR